MTLFALMQAEGIPCVLLREAYVMAGERFFENRLNSRWVTCCGKPLVAQDGVFGH